MYDYVPKYTINHNSISKIVQTSGGPTDQPNIIKKNKGYCPECDIPMKHTISHNQCDNCGIIINSKDNKRSKLPPTSSCVRITTGKKTNSYGVRGTKIKIHNAVDYSYTQNKIIWQQLVKNQADYINTKYSLLETTITSGGESAFCANIIPIIMDDMQSDTFNEIAQISINEKIGIVDTASTIVIKPIDNVAFSIIVLKAAQEQYHIIQQLKELDLINAVNQGNFLVDNQWLTDNTLCTIPADTSDEPATKKLVHRADIKDEILAALIYFEGVRAGIIRKKSDIAIFMKLPNNGFTRGEELVRNLCAEGLISLPVGEEPIIGFVERYLEALGISEKYSQFIVDVVELSKQKKVCMASQDSSKIVAVIWTLIDKLKLKITISDVERATDNTKKNTFMKFHKEIMSNMHIFGHLFDKYSVPRMRF